jgi:hypothetical protein
MVNFGQPVLRRRSFALEAVARVSRLRRGKTFIVYKFSLHLRFLTTQHKPFAIKFTAFL